MFFLILALQTAYVANTATGDPASTVDSHHTATGLLALLMSPCVVLLTQCFSSCQSPAKAEALDLNLTVLETLQNASPDAQVNDLKQLLGRMMFSGSAMDKKVKVLSGGEKARLALAKFMCTQVSKGERGRGGHGVEGRLAGG